MVEFNSEFPLEIKEYNFLFEFPVKPNHHDYLEIVYILENKATIQCGEKKYNVKKNDLLIIGKNEIHGCFQYGFESISLMSLQFLPELIYNATGCDIDFEFIRPFYCKSPDFINLLSEKRINTNKIYDKIKDIKNLIRYKKKNYKIKAKKVLLEILVEIVEYYGEIPEIYFENHNRHISDLDRLKDVFNLLEKHYNKNITLEEAAKTACLNKCYFSRFFKLVMGFTFTNYLQRIRIEKSKELLLNSDFTISRIAFLTGFNTLSFFNRTFKKFVKMAPNQFRKSKILP